MYDIWSKTIKPKKKTKNKQNPKFCTVFLYQCANKIKILDEVGHSI